MDDYQRGFADAKELAAKCCERPTLNGFSDSTCAYFAATCRSLSPPARQTGAIETWTEQCPDAAERRRQEQQPAGADALLTNLRALIADDGYAITFQSIGQYRGWLLQSIDAARLGENGAK